MWPHGKLLRTETSAAVWRQKLIYCRGSEEEERKDKNKRNPRAENQRLRWMEFEQFGFCIPLSITIYMDYAFILFSIVCAPDPRALPTLATASRPKSVSHPPAWRYPLRFAFRIRQRCRHLATILPPIANQNPLFFFLRFITLSFLSSSSFSSTFQFYPSGCTTLGFLTRTFSSTHPPAWGPPRLPLKTPFWRPFSTPP